MLHDHFRSLARFNAWANRRIYDAVEALPAGEYDKPRPAAYFGSIHGTLNHLLATDRLWFGRIEGVERGVTALDQILCEDLAPLRAARAAEDARIVALVDALDEGALAGDLSYRSMAGGAMTLPLRVALAAVFNHQTHHRGQVHALIKEAGAEPPPLDIPVYWSDQGGRRRAAAARHPGLLVRARADAPSVIRFRDSYSGALYYGDSYYRDSIFISTGYFVLRGQWAC
jgi:uncharacterized damage-inducible protein DinB